MVEVVHEVIDDEQAQTHIWIPDNFCAFGLEHSAPINPIFEPCPFNAKSHNGGKITVRHICQFSSALTWIIVH